MEEVEELVYKKENWMYRIHERYRADLPTGLCPLFWSAVRLWAKYYFDILLKIAFAGAYFVSIGYAIYKWIAYLFFGIDFEMNGENGDNVAFFGTFFIVVTVVVGSAIGYVTHKQAILSRLPKWMTKKKEKKEKQPSAFVAYIKARHAKMCPPVRFED